VKRNIKVKNMAKKCILVLGGEIKDMAAFAASVKDADFIMAADSGAGHLLKIQVMPHLLMGDFDSIDREDLAVINKSDCRIANFPREKDDTDSKLILQEAIAAEFEYIEIWGALGGRPDHGFANILLLLTARSLFAQMKNKEAGQEPFVCLCDGGVRIFLAQKGQKVEGEPGDVLSLFALGEDVTGFSGQGLRYQPPGGRYSMADPALGISNELAACQAVLNWDKGILLCMHISKKFTAKEETVND